VPHQARPQRSGGLEVGRILLREEPKAGKILLINQGQPVFLPLL
jgi:hypothetical protein